jgi:uncharacterized protein YggT (Ycf19 family)
MVSLITQAVGSFIKLYLLLLFVRVLLTWFPNVDWMSQPWQGLADMPAVATSSNALRFLLRCCLHCHPTHF